MLLLVDHTSAVKSPACTFHSHAACWMSGMLRTTAQSTVPGINALLRRGGSEDVVAGQAGAAARGDAASSPQTSPPPLKPWRTSPALKASKPSPHALRDVARWWP
jgi:hypothetical protein